MFWKRSFDGLDALVAERGSALLATAVLLTGSRAAGEDLLQGALERLMRSWGRVREDGTRFMGGEPPLTPLPPDKTPGEKYGRYGQYPGKHDHLSLCGDADTVLGAASPDPAALFKALQQADATTTQNPDGTLHFDYATQDAQGSTTTAGDVTLNADGRIAKVALTGTWQSTAKGRLDTGTFRATLELSDYGVPVHVDRPADVVPA